MSTIATRASGAPLQGERSNWFVTFLDRYMPDHVRHASEDEKRQVRSGIGFIWASMLMTAVFVVANFKQGNIVAGYWEVGVFFVLIALLPLMRRTGRVALVGNICMFCGVSSISLACWYTDGLEAPPLLILMIVPAWGYLGYGKATAVTWTWLSALVVVVLYVAERKNLIPPPAGTPEKIQAKRFAEALFTLGFGYLASRISTDIKDYAVSMLQRRSFELKQMHGRLENLFESMTQGVLTFDAARRIDASVSSRAHAVFGREHLEDVDVAELLFEGDEDTTGQRELLESFVELAFESGAKDWNELAQCAPDRVKRRGPDGQTQHLLLEFRPVLGADDRLERIMLLVTDDSERVRMELAARAQDAAHRREVDALRRLVAGGAHLVLQFLDVSERRLREASDSLLHSNKLDPSQVALAFQHMHTVRGEARTFQLMELSTVCAEIEELLSPLRASGFDASLSPDVAAALERGLQKAKELLGQARARLVELSPVGEAVLDQVTVRKSQVRRLIELLDHAPGTTDELQKAARSLASRPFGESTQQLSRAVAEWAAARSRMIEFVVEGREEPVPSQLGEVLPGVLGHLARNAVAHGIELPNERAKKHKPERGRLRLSCEAHPSGGVHIQIEDDGAGVDEEKLRLAAERAGLSEQLTLTDLLFTPFVSTANDVGDIAGRGVGMAAVRKELRDAGYEIEVTSRADEGTRIDILPRGAQRMPEKRASTQVA